MAVKRLQREPDAIIEEYRITSDDIRSFISAKCAHITDKFKLRKPIKAEISTTLWDRSRKDYSRSNKKYVLLMIALNEDSLEYGQTEESAGLIKDILIENSQVRFVKCIWKLIVEKYQYDRKELNDIRKSDKLLDKLEDTLGITEDQLKELIKLSQPHIHTINGDHWVIFAVRPENVIRDMLSDVDTDQVDGKMVITNITPITKDRVEFTVHIYRGEDREAPVNNEVLEVLQNA